MKSIADLRQDYSKSSLEVANVLPDPVEQFEKWFQEALQAGVPEANAMNLATVNQQGQPSARIVLLKGVEAKQFLFFTNYQSHKGVLLDNNPACALTFFWPELERQVRIEGIAQRLDAPASEAYFQSRPRGSQIGAWASPQSSIIESRMILEERVQQLERRFDGQAALPKPHQWGGYAVTASMIEFWQGRPSRLHDRIVYTRTDGQWKIHRLAP